MNNYNIEIRQFNGIDYDVLYPVTKIENVDNLQGELNKKSTMLVSVVNLSSTGWVGDGSTTPYTQQINVSGVLSTDHILINIVPSSTYTTAIDQVNQFQYINYTTPSNGSIKFTCLTRKPTIPLSVKVLCFR